MPPIPVREGLVPTLYGKGRDTRPAHTNGYEPWFRYDTTLPAMTAMPCAMPSSSMS